MFLEDEKLQLNSYFGGDDDNSDEGSSDDPEWDIEGDDLDIDEPGEESLEELEEEEEKKMSEEEEDL